jgi:hypothetical protein
LIRLSGLLALMNSSLKSFRKGNLALSVARSLLDTTYCRDVAGSGAGITLDDSSAMKSRASLADADSSSGDRADGKPYCDIRSGFV